MSTFSFWKAHNLNPFWGLTEVSSHGTAPSREERPEVSKDAHTAPVPRTLFRNTPSSSPAAYTTHDADDSGSATSPANHHALPMSCVPNEQRPCTALTGPPARPPLMPSTRPTVPRGRRPQSAVTPNLRKYYNHLVPLSATSRQYMAEYKASAPASRATSARPARMASPSSSTCSPRHQHVASTTTQSSTSPTAAAPAEQQMDVVAVRAVAAPAHDALATTPHTSPTSASSAKSSPHWTELRKPRPHSPVSGRRHSASLSNHFSAVALLPEETEPQGAASLSDVFQGGARRRSSEAAFTTRETVHVLREHLPNIVLQTPRDDMPVTNNRGTQDPSAAVLQAYEDGLRASARQSMPSTRTTMNTSHNTNNSKRVNMTALPHGLTASSPRDEEMLEASARAQTDTFREGEDGRPVTAKPLQRRLSPVLKLEARCVADDESSAQCTSAETNTTGCAAAWRPTVMATVHTKGDITAVAATGQTLGDYDWIADKADTTNNTSLDHTAFEHDVVYDDEEDDDYAIPFSGAGAAAPHMNDDEEEEGKPEDDDVNTFVPVIVASVHRVSQVHLLSPHTVPLEVSTPHRSGKRDFPRNTTHAADNDNDVAERECLLSRTEEGAVQAHNHAEDAASPLPKPPPCEHRHDSTRSTTTSMASTQEPPSEAETTEHTVRESFVDLLPGLYPPGERRARHSVNVQKERLSRAVPVMVADPSTMITEEEQEEEAEAEAQAARAPHTPRDITSLDDVSACFAPTPTAAHGDASGTDEMTTAAHNTATATTWKTTTPSPRTEGIATVRKVSGVVYPSSSLSTPSGHDTHVLRPMNPRLSQDASTLVPFTRQTTSRRVSTPRELAAAAAVVAVPVPSSSSSATPTRVRATANVATPSSRLPSLRGGSAGAASSATEYPSHLASQLRQAIRDASLMREEPIAKRAANGDVNVSTAMSSCTE